MEEGFICTEGPVIMPEQALLEPAHQQKWKNTLIGELFITDLKSIKPYHVIRDINRAWTGNTTSKFKIMELGKGMFGFHFEDEKDMKWVMDSRPWLVTDEYYNQYLLGLTEWCPNTPPFKVPFDSNFPFWVQVHDVPLEYMSREMGRKIGEGTGHVVLDVDFDEGKSEMKFLRVRVMVNVTKKLATGCWLLIDKNQPYEFLWVPFKYEKLPMICYRCGIIGHSKNSCSNKDEVEDAIAISYNPELSVYESEVPAVLVEGQVLRVEGKKGYGHWLYEDIDSDDEDYEEDEDYNVDDEDESESNDEDYEGLVDIDEVVTVSDEEMENGRK